MKFLVSRISTACLLSVLVTSTASAGIFHKKHSNKPSPEYPLAGDTSKQPDKQLFDKAMEAMRKGRFDVARLDLQTLLNTYPESEYQMRAKLAVGDTWFKEGGTAALTQAEAEYKDFITFFPNQPEAAEAQMRVADIYYMQMEKPDRDPTSADRAEQEYRTMIQQFPESPLVPRAEQKLREVQEVLAERQYEIGAFYASHENWPASIARLQTVADSYPLFSHSDDVLIGLGDAYSAEARFVQNLPRLSQQAKQELMKMYDDRAAAEYGRVVTHYAMSPHVEDARERLIALNRPVPEPTPGELQASETEEQSRTGITFKDRALFLMKRGPVTVDAARVGNPTLTDVPAVMAPEVNKENVAAFSNAIAGKPIPKQPDLEAAAEARATPTAAPGSPQAGAADDSTPLQLENVPAASENGRSSGPTIGASIVSEGGSAAGSQEGTGSSPAAASPASVPAGGGVPTATPAAPPAAAPATTPPPASTDTGDAGVAAAAAGVRGAQNPGGLDAVGPATNGTLPPVQKPAAMAAQTNDVHDANTAPVSTGTTVGVKGKHKKKNPSPKFNSGDESSSKHKKKKGLDKLNPF